MAELTYNIIILLLLLFFKHIIEIIIILIFNNKVSLYCRLVEDTIVLCQFVPIAIGIVMNLVVLLSSPLLLLHIYSDSTTAFVLKRLSLFTAEKNNE